MSELFLAVISFGRELSVRDVSLNHNREKEQHIAEHFSCRALSHYLSRTYLQKGQHVGGPKVYQPWLLRVHPREIKLVVVVVVVVVAVVVGAKPPPKCFTISWKFRVISYYFERIDSFYTKLGE